MRRTSNNHYAPVGQKIKEGKEMNDQAAKKGSTLLGWRNDLPVLGKKPLLSNMHAKVKKSGEKNQA